MASSTSSSSSPSPANQRISRFLNSTPSPSDENLEVEGIHEVDDDQNNDADCGCAGGCTGRDDSEEEGGDCEEGAVAATAGAAKEEERGPGNGCGSCTEADAEQAAGDGAECSSSAIVAGEDPPGSKPLGSAHASTTTAMTAATAIPSTVSDKSAGSSGAGDESASKRRCDGGGNGGDDDEEDDGRGGEDRFDESGLKRRGGGGRRIGSGVAGSAATGSFSLSNACIDAPGSPEDNEVSSPFATRRGRCLSFSNVCLSVAKSDVGRKRRRRTRKEMKNDYANSISINDASSDTSRLPSNVNKVILDNVSGEVPAGQITAIMGTSGSGKTSLLNVLSGRISAKNNSRMTVQSDGVFLSDKPVDPSHIAVRQAIAFVAQYESLPITATPREALFFSARLRRPKSNTDKELRVLVERMLTELHLQDCADTIMGSSGGLRSTGVSGGERKRTSVGVELVTQPSLVFLDEPTSGLDSFNALELCQVLRKVAAAGSAVLLTIHQPSSEIFTSAIDNLILLKQGRVLYGGKQGDVCDYFENRGFACPVHHNPADYILHIAQTHTIQQLQSDGFFPASTSPVRNKAYASAASPSSSSLSQYPINRSEQRKSQRDSTHSLVMASAEPKLSFARQAGILFHREILHVKRNKKALAARAGMTLMISGLNGAIFYQVAKNDYRDYVNAQSTLGAVLVSLLANVFSTAVPTMVAFPEERPVFLREYSTNHYSVPAYFVARLAMEMFVTGCQALVSSLLTYFLMGFSAPFGVFWSSCYTLAMTSTALGVLIGCSAKDPGVALEFLPLVFTPQIIFSGFFIPPELIPIWLRWLNWVFPLVYAVKIVIVAQFYTSGVCGDAIPNNCERILKQLDSSPADTWWYWLVLVGQFFLFRIVALIALRKKAVRFY